MASGIGPAEPRIAYTRPSSGSAGTRLTAHLDRESLVRSADREQRAQETVSQYKNSDPRKQCGEGQYGLLHRRFDSTSAIIVDDTAP